MRLTKHTVEKVPLTFVASTVSSKTHRRCDGRKSSGSNGIPTALPLTHPGPGGGPSPLLPSPSPPASACLILDHGSTLSHWSIIFGCSPAAAAARPVSVFASAPRGIRVFASAPRPIRVTVSVRRPQPIRVTASGPQPWGQPQLRVRLTGRQRFDF